MTPSTLFRPLILIILLLLQFYGSYTRNVIMLSSFDLDIPSKSPLESQYHQSIAPSLSYFVNHPHIVSFRALHPLLSSSTSRSHMLMWEFNNFSAYSSFLRDSYLQYLGIASWWKRSHHTLWVEVSQGPRHNHTSWEGKVFHILLIYCTPHPNDHASSTQPDGNHTINKISLNGLTIISSAVQNIDGFLDAKAYVDPYQGPFPGNFLFFIEFETFSSTHAFLEPNSWMKIKLLIENVAQVVSIEHWISTAPIYQIQTSSP